MTAFCFILITDFQRKARMSMPYFGNQQFPDSVNSKGCQMTVVINNGNACGCSCQAPAEEPSTPSFQENFETPAPTPEPGEHLDDENHNSGTLSFNGSFCSHHYNCIDCGTLNSTSCAKGDGNAIRGQCYYEWNDEEFFAKHCTEHPKCSELCKM